MRTTLTLDKDVAAMVRRAMKRGDRSLKELINTALRRGLAQMEPPPPTRYELRPLNLGGSLVGSLDNVEDVLARAEGAQHK
jgi:hypothetical protein